MPASIGVNLRVTGHCSQGGRKYMEDFFSVAYQQSLSDERDLEYAFIGIYDGHGGAEAATFAKEHLINLIVNQKIFWSNDDRDILRAIREGYIATHYAMWREQEKWPKTGTGLPSTAGTTASIAFIRHGKIYIGHVGDSGIVLGYQEDGEKFWRAKQLTQDHKPECNIEKARIMNSGGKVITKSGVPRVVWNRPRLGHKGPVRRSTPIDEIPFLAVARSLGDFWSYNSANGEFVVSPDPDVRVIKIDPKKFRCLIFGTDGLWNVLTDQAAVENVRLSEQMNERAACVNGARDWMNPSKNLVDRALERWSTSRMRADNTSVCVIMLDPPGPPKRDVLKACPSQSYQMDYLTVQQTSDFEQADRLDNEPNDSFTMFDHSTNEHIDLDAIPLPTNGLAIMTRYEHTNDSDFIVDKHQNGYVSVVDNSQINTDVPYMNSFAESYNSLLNSSLENDHSYIYNNDQQDADIVDDVDFDDDSGDGSSHHFAAAPQLDTYSLTKLQTRSEQQCSMYGEPSTSSSTAAGINGYFTDYQHELDHNYVSDLQQSYGLMSDDYISYGGHPSNLNAHTVHMNITPLNAGEYVTNSFHNLHSDYYADHKVIVSPNTSDITIIRNCQLKPVKSYVKTSSDRYANHTVENHLVGSDDSNCVAENNYSSINDSLENSIQINEISSSNASELTTSITVAPASKTTNPTSSSKTKTSSSHKKFERVVTRSSYAQSQRVTRSSKTDQKYNKIFKKCKSVMKKTDISNRKTIQGLKSTLEALINKRASGGADTNRLHKENISLLRKMRSIEKNKLRDKSRDATLAAAALNCHANIGRRMLRSQNNVTKDQAKESSATNNNMQSSANVPKTEHNSTVNAGELKRPTSNSNMQVNLVNNSRSVVSDKDATKNNSTRQLRDPKFLKSSSPISSNSRCKMLLPKKSVMMQRCNAFFDDVSKTMITRRTRLHH